MATFVDSTILGVLVGAQQRLDRLVNPLTVVCTRDTVLDARPAMVAE